LKWLKIEIWWNWAPLIRVKYSFVEQGLSSAHQSWDHSPNKLVGFIAILQNGAVQVFWFVISFMLGAMKFRPMIKTRVLQIDIEKNHTSTPIYTISRESASDIRKFGLIPYRTQILNIKLTKVKEDCYYLLHGAPSNNADP
jgi:hypothetical protein